MGKTLKIPELCEKAPCPGLIQVLSVIFFYFLEMPSVSFLAVRAFWDQRPSGLCFLFQWLLGHCFRRAIQPFIFNGRMASSWTAIMPFYFNGHLALVLRIVCAPLFFLLFFSFHLTFLFLFLPFFFLILLFFFFFFIYFSFFSIFFSLNFKKFSCIFNNTKLT